MAQIVKDDARGGMDKVVLRSESVRFRSRSRRGGVAAAQDARALARSGIVSLTPRPSPLR
jgi:hypothetical protein